MPKNIQLIDLHYQHDYLHDGIMFIFRLAMIPDGCPPLPAEIAKGDPSLDIIKMHAAPNAIFQYDANAMPEPIATFNVPIRRIKVMLPMVNLVDNPVVEVVKTLKDTIKELYPDEFTEASTVWQTIHHRVYSTVYPNSGALGTKPGIPYVSDVLADESLKLPGVRARICCPVCPKVDILWKTVQHVNDFHKWDRHRIADWLDKLYDDGVVDLAFKEKV